LWDSNDANWPAELMKITYKRGLGMSWIEHIGGDSLA